MISDKTIKNMIFMKNFIIFIVCLVHTYAIQWALDGVVCTFTGVRTTESNLYFNPSAENDSVVLDVFFEE